jgi:tetratricopeptide (TPR) repeat protein
MEYADLKQNNLAEDAYQHAIDLDSTNAVALYNLGNLKLVENKLEDAEKLWTRAINADPKFVYGYNQLIYYYQQTGQKEKMLRVYKQWQKTQ